MLLNATPLRKSAPWPPNISDEHVSCTAPATENASLQILFKCPTPHLNVKKCSKPVSQYRQFFTLLTSTCASRHKGVHFFDISTSKSAPKMRCFAHFDFEMRFALQRRALFRHVTFKKCSEAEVLCTFWLRNVLRATAACKFSSLIWPDGSAPAALASLLFDPPEPQIIGKTECLATFLPFRAPRSSFFGDFHFFDILSSSLLFSDSSHLCCSSVHSVGSLTSKLPSTTFVQNWLASRLPSVSCTNSSPPLPGRTWHCADARQRRLPFSIPGILCGRLRSRCFHGLPPSLCLWFSPDWHRQFLRPSYAHAKTWNSKHQISRSRISYYVVLDWFEEILWHDLHMHRQK